MSTHCGTNLDEDLAVAEAEFCLFDALREQLGQLLYLAHHLTHCVNNEFLQLEFFMMQHKSAQLSQLSSDKCLIQHSSSTIAAQLAHAKSPAARARPRHAQL